MVDVSKLKKKSASDSYIGARVTEDLKLALDTFCEDEGVKTSPLLTALVEDFLRSKGYWPAEEK